MCELLIKATDAANPDSTVDRGCYKKGDIVFVAPDDHPWGTKECPPLFVIVKIPGVSVSSALDYMSAWAIAIDYQILSGNDQTGVYQVQISCSNPGASGAANLTLDQVSNYLRNWGATLNSSGANQVTFTINLWHTLQSSSFWGVDVSNISFSLASYSNPIATVNANLLNILGKLDADNVKKIMVEHEASIISYSAPILQFSIDRSTVINSFKNDLLDKLQIMFKRRKYYFASADVDTALSQSGIVSLTASQVTSHLLNKLDQ